MIAYGCCGPGRLDTKVAAQGLTLCQSDGLRIDAHYVDIPGTITNVSVERVITNVITGP